MYRVILFVLLFTSEEIEGLLLYHHFGFSVRELAGKQVLFRGHILTIELSKDYFVLSKDQTRPCFFCGAGGQKLL